MFGLCDHPGCKCQSRCRPTVIVRSKDDPVQDRPAADRFVRLMAGLDAYEIQYEVQMEFCSAHQDTFREKFLLNEASWSAIENQIASQGMAPPDKDSVRIEWRSAAGADGLDDIGRSALEVVHGRELGSHPMSASASPDKLKKIASEGIYPAGM